MRTHQIEPLTKPVSAIGMGTMIFHPDTQERDFSLLDAFVANGGTYVDTAEVYGAIEEHGYSEMVIGEWLKARDGMREKIVLASKGLIPGYCAPLHPGGAKIDPESIHKAIDGSLERLQTGYLDIWMFHRDDPNQPVSELVDALDQEVSNGRLRAYGASNWPVRRIEGAIGYAQENGKAKMMSSSPNFSLAQAKEPFWPDTETVSAADRQWYEENNFMLVAWSSLGRGFFAKASPDDTSDADLVRVFYSPANFKRKERASEMAVQRGCTMSEVALAYVVNQDYPVVALNGAQTPDEVASSLKAADMELSKAERDWLDLNSDERPF